MYEANDALLCIAQGAYVTQSDRYRISPEHYFKTAAQMEELFRDLTAALANTVSIAQRCHFLLQPVAPHLPTYVSAAQSQPETLKEQARKGLQRRFETHVFKRAQAPPNKKI